MRSIFREVEASYNESTCGCDDCQSTRLEAVNLEPYNKLIEKIAKDLHEGVLEPSDLNADLIRQIYADVSEGAKKVYGDKWVNLDVKEPNSLLQKFKKNLWQFSNAKTLAELQQMNSLLLDKGRIRSFDEFRKAVQKENIKFNKNYLQAEYQTAVKASQSAERWRKFFKNADLFPNIKYNTVGDDRVRPEHAALNGIIKPINDPFWRTYATPNGWRCRCYETQTAETATPGQFDDPSVKPEFRGNVYFDEEIFTQKGGFFKLLNKDHKAKTNAELMKLNAPYEVAYIAKNGKKVLVNIFAHEEDKINNIETAMVIADKLAINVKIRPHINIQNHKNPEYEINGIIADRAEPKSENIKRGIANAFDDKLGKGKQLRNFDRVMLAVDISSYDLSNKNIEDIINQSWQKFKHYSNKNLEGFIIIHKNNALLINKSIQNYEAYRSEIMKIRKGKK